MGTIIAILTNVFMFTVELLILLVISYVISRILTNRKWSKIITISVGLCFSAAIFIDAIRDPSGYTTPFSDEEFGNDNSNEYYYEDTTENNDNPGTHHVNGYYRSDGTYVNGYERSNPDGNPYNNLNK